jgi:hypothetical protein
MTRPIQVTFRWYLPALLMICLPLTASAADWGTLKGRFVYAGKDEGKPIAVTKDVEFCNQHKPQDESIDLGEKGGLRNVFVYLNTKRGKSVDVHPDYQKDADTPVVIDNRGCRFEPHAMTVWTEHPLEIRNSDSGIGHNTNAQKLVANAKFNEQISNDRPAVKKFTKSEPMPTQLACNVHPWMNGYVLIRDNPYMAVAGEDGSFEIKNIPAGTHEFILWHEAKGYVRDLKVGKEETDRKGRIDIKIAPGETVDLGEIKVTPDLLDQ